MNTNIHNHMSLKDFKLGERKKLINFECYEVFGFGSYYLHLL